MKYLKNCGKYRLIKKKKASKIWKKSYNKKHNFCTKLHISLVNNKTILSCLECSKIYFDDDFRSLNGFDIKLKNGIRQINQR